MWTICIGVASFIVGGILAVLLVNIFRIHNVGFSYNTSPAESISIEFLKTVIVILFQLLTFLMLFLQLRRITGESSWTGMVSTYRLLTGRLQDLNDTSTKFPWILRQFLEGSFAIGLVYVYIIGNNLAAHKKHAKLIGYLLFYV